MIDSQLVLMDAQTVTCNAASTVVGETVVYIPAVATHTGAAMDDKTFLNRNLCFHVTVDTATVAAVDGAAVTVALYNDTDSTPTTGGTVIATTTFTENTPTEHPAGTVILSTPLPTTGLKPYFGVLVSVATQNIASGKLNAWIGPPITAT